MSLRVFNVDSLEQYGRHENLRIYGIPKNVSNKDDGEEVVSKLAEELDIDVQRS